MESHATNDSHVFRWNINNEAGAVTVSFVGVIDETADFTDLTLQLHGTVVFELEKVRRLNSAGVRQWVNFVCHLPAVEDLTFCHCSPAIVDQMDMIYNFRGFPDAHAHVESILLPYVCEQCSREELATLALSLLEQGCSIEDAILSLSPPCPACQTPMAFAELAEQYLSFLEVG